MQLGTITLSVPMNVIAIDFRKVDQCTGGYKYILVIVEHFTHYAQAYATRNKSGKTAPMKYSIILPFTLACKAKYCTTKEESSKIIYLRNKSHVRS